jgi:hypothetical protein
MSSNLIGGKKSFNLYFVRKRKDFAMIRNLGHLSIIHETTPKNYALLTENEQNLKKSDSNLIYFRF